MFNSSVHEQNLPKVSKFSYLNSVLKNSAISGIPVTTENYDTVITLLKEKFGKKEAIIESLYAKLQNLPKANNKFSEIKHTHEVIEKLLRQLEAQGECINEQRMLIQLLICKYDCKARNLVLHGVCQHCKKPLRNTLQCRKMHIIMLLMKEANLMNHQGLHTDLRQMSLLIMSIALEDYLIFFAKEITTMINTLKRIGLLGHGDMMFV